MSVNLWLAIDVRGFPHEQTLPARAAARSVLCDEGILDEFLSRNALPTGGFSRATGVGGEAVLLAGSLHPVIISGDYERFLTRLESSLVASVAKAIGARDDVTAPADVPSTGLNGTGVHVRITARDADQELLPGLFVQPNASSQIDARHLMRLLHFIEGCRDDALESLRSKDLVPYFPGLANVCSRLTTWEQRASLVFVTCDFPDAALAPIYRDLLRAPSTLDDDIFNWSLASAIDNLQALAIEQTTGGLWSLLWEDRAKIDRCRRYISSGGALPIPKSVVYGP